MSEEQINWINAALKHLEDNRKRRLNEIKQIQKEISILHTIKKVLRNKITKVIDFAESKKS